MRRSTIAWAVTGSLGLAGLCGAALAAGDGPTETSLPSVSISGSAPVGGLSDYAARQAGADQSGNAVDQGHGVPSAGSHDGVMAEVNNEPGPAPSAGCGEEPTISVLGVAGAGERDTDEWCEESVDSAFSADSEDYPASCAAQHRTLDHGVSEDADDDDDDEDWGD